MESSILLPEAPGAKAARRCGIWALVLVVIFFPASLVLAIIAIVQNLRAKFHARKAPQSYRVPSRAGTIMGVISLLATPIFVFFVGVLALVVVSRRTWARDQVALANLSAGVAELARNYGAMQGRMETEIHQNLEAHLRGTRADIKNPWNPKAPAFDYSVAVLSGLDEKGVREAARARAAALGQTVFVVQFPASSGQGGFLAGAVHTRAHFQESTVTTEAVSLK